MRHIDVGPKRDWLFADRESLSRKVHQDDRGYWVPASGGTETPFKARSGRTLLYCWNSGTGQHAYLDCDSDVILSNEEAFAHLGMC